MAVTTVKSASREQKLLSHIGAAFIRLVGLTLRIRMEDQDDCAGLQKSRRFIFLFWHNRMFVTPLVYERWFSSGKGVSVLTSASRDGALLAEFMRRFGIGAVRGSTSKRGAGAILEMRDVLATGVSIVITPDGPRGPRYKLGPGAVHLAQLTGTEIVPVHVEYSRCIRLKSWDQFMIPLPFSRVTVTFGPRHAVAKSADDEAFETERLLVEKMLQPATP